MNHNLIEFFVDTTNKEATSYIYKIIEECKTAGLPIYLMKDHQEGDVVSFYLKGTIKTYEKFIPEHNGSNTPEKFHYSLEHFLD